MNAQEKKTQSKQYPQTNIRFNLDDKEQIYLIARYLHERGFPGYLDEQDKPSITKVLRYLLETEAARISRRQGGEQPTNPDLKTARENIVKLLRNVSETEVARYLEESLTSLDRGVEAIAEQAAQQRSYHVINVPVSPYMTQVKDRLVKLLEYEDNTAKREELEALLALVERDTENFAQMYQAILEGRWNASNEDNA